MKTVKQLENEKEILQSELLANYLINKKGWKKNFEDLQALETLIAYLKTNPKEEFIKEQIAKSEVALALIHSQYEPLDPRFHTKSVCLKHKQRYEKLYDITHKKFQIKNLKYLLS